MLGKLRHRLVVGLLAFGVVFAMPLAGAFGTGIDAASVPAVKSAGASPQYGQTWVGPWMKTSGWSGFENDLRTMKNNGVTPVIMWYYWGDQISPNCVSYGCSGRAKWEWDSMAKDMTTRAKNIMGGSTFLVVLEPEFNKNGISSMEAFDGYLADQAWAIKNIAPSAKIVVGFGYWGGWDIFDRAVARADYVGFQLLRGSTRDSQQVALDTASQIISITKTLKSKWGKDVVMFDLAIASYGGWEWIQEKVLQNVQARRGEMDAAGLRILIWRYLSDNNYSSGYYGAAESTWGVKYAGGGAKSAYDDLLNLIRNSGGSTPTSGTTTTTTTSAAPSTNVFSAVSGNAWWIQGNVAGTPSRVEARVNGGAAVALTKQSWGAWAKSLALPAGSSVELRATYADGTSRAVTYTWGASGPTSGGTTTSTPTSTTTTSGSNNGFPAGFGGVTAKNWWTQVSVTSTYTVTGVDVRVNGGAWQPLTKQSWGGWAKSFALSPGQKIEFQARNSAGATTGSGVFWST